MKIIPVTKKCTRCTEVRKAEDFYILKSSRYKEGTLSSWCRPCQIENANYHKYKDLERWKNNQREYRAKNKDKDRNRRLMKLCGITLEHFNSLPKVCSICESTENLCADHCHETGTFRAILCSHCNRGLGFFKDNPALLIKAADYLNKYNWRGME